MDFVTFFMRQHAAVHASDVSGHGLPIQRIFGELSDDQMRMRPGMGLTYPWLGWTRGDQLASSALRHNAAHIGEAVTILGLAGVAHAI